VTTGANASARPCPHSAPLIIVAGCLIAAIVHMPMAERQVERPALA